MATIGLTVPKVQEMYLRTLAGRGGALVRFRCDASSSSRLGPLSLSFLWLSVALVTAGLPVLGVPKGILCPSRAFGSKGELHDRQQEAPIDISPGQDIITCKGGPLSRLRAAYLR